MIGNMLGAAALLIVDEADRRVAAAGGQGRTATAALVALHYFGPLGATAIARQLHLSQPAATRLIHGLESERLCRRVAVPGKASPVELTAVGAEVVAEALSARGDLVVDLVGSLTTPERTQLAGLLDKLLTAGFEHTPDARYLCRLCERDSCGDRTARCPIGRAAGECRSS